MKNKRQYILFRYLMCGKLSCTTWQAAYVQFLRKIAGAICLLALFLCFRSSTVCATENMSVQDAAVVSSRTSEEGIFIYMKGISGLTDGTTVQVGNTLCEDIQGGHLASMDVQIRTLILFDNSLSLSKSWGSQAKDLLQGLIDNHAEGEVFQIATFADGLNVLSDFTTDYEALKTAADGIEFLDQDTYLTDILYDLLEQEGSRTEPDYTRFVIITDGADDNDIKYTQNELSDLMKNSGVVIHTVGVKTSDNASLLETLFSYARFTGGTYHVAEKSTDVKVLKETIQEDHSLFCLRLVPPADIMDGSRKEAKLNLHTEKGPLVLTASLQMPFADIGSLPSESVVPSAPTATESPKLPSITVESQTVEEAPEFFGFRMSLVIVIVIVVLLVAVAALLGLLAWKGKKKRQVDVVMANEEPLGDGEKYSGKQVTPPQPDGQTHSGANTVRLGGHVNRDIAGKTIHLQDRAGQKELKRHYIVLTDINNPQRSFRVPINRRIIIGRESGDIKLSHDDTVSHTHCEIIKKGNLYYINDLKSSNGTFYGSMRVYHETPVMNGGILEVGTCKYKISIEFE